jgi:hypothetical protein
MRIPLTEPQSPRYLAINPKTNRVHLFVPFVAGLDISTDNTCKAMLELKHFFESGAIAELESYESALAFDISLLEAGSPLRQSKEERLVQIKQYLEAVKAMQKAYGPSISHFLKKPSNLYSIQLRPRAQDPYSKVENPVFTINRGNDRNGTPLSSLFNSMQASFANVSISEKTPQQKLVDATVAALPNDASLDDIKRALSETSLAEFNIPLDFTRLMEDEQGLLIKDKDKKHVQVAVDKAYIDEKYGVKLDTVQEYAEALLSICAPNLETTVETSPFYKSIDTRVGRAEHLSIMTQFYLGVLNVYCRARGLSEKNFGIVLDKDPVLSTDLVDTIAEVLSAGDNVERIVCDFCTVHEKEFGLSRVLNPEDKSMIQDKFSRAWRTVTATKENPHMDDFMLLDTEDSSDKAKLLSHNGLICTDFTNIVDTACPNQEFFDQIRQDKMEVSLSPQPSAIPEIEVDVETLLNNLNNVQWDKLPKAVKEACQKEPAFQHREFLDDAAKGKQEEAKILLEGASNKGALLRKVAKFTDYSGRTFECTAYEYAYWAKDRHMLRMLESYMKEDEETKAFLLQRVEEIEKNGLTYLQHGKTVTGSKHFDLSILINALDYYVKIYNGSNTWHEIEAAWMAVGKAQRDVPAHVAHEYCRPDRSFNPTPEVPVPTFNEETLPRVLTIYNSVTNVKSWFPLASSSSGLGFDFALVRAPGDGALAIVGVAGGCELLDLAAIRHLDEVRTADLTLSREYLNSPASFHGLSM